MIKKFKDIDGVKLSELTIGDYNYFEKEKMHICIHDNKIRVTDITHSLKWGKTCKEYIITSLNGGFTAQNISPIQSIIDKYKLTLYDLFDDTVLAVIAHDLETVYSIDIDFYTIERKGVNTYSPFVSISKSRVNIPDRRFGRWHLIKMLIAGNIKASEELILEIVEIQASKQKTKLELILISKAVVSYTSKTCDYEFIADIEPETMELAA